MRCLFVFVLQMSVFHALGLAPVRYSYFLDIPIPLDTRRVVLLVPKSGLSLLREVSSTTEIFLSLSGKLEPFDYHFASIHTAFVRVCRGSSHGQDNHADLFSLSSHLAVRDTRESDPEAELMVSAVVPTYALMTAPPGSTELQLRPRDSAKSFDAPGQRPIVFFKADLADIDKTAILTTGATRSFCSNGMSFPSLPCPEMAAAYRPDDKFPPSQSSPRQMGPASDQTAVKYRFMYDAAAIEQSVELIDQDEDEGKARLVYRVTLNMGSAEARTALAAGGKPGIENSRDPCTVRIKLGKKIHHDVNLPFPVQQSSIRMKFSQKQAFVSFTVIPQSSAQPQLGVAWIANDIEGVGRRILPSMLSSSPSPPLSCLPRLDFNAEWAHEKVRFDRVAHWNAQRHCNHCTA